MINLFINTRYTYEKVGNSVMYNIYIYFVKMESIFNKMCK